MIPVRTVSGRRIDLSRPRAEDFDLGDIATGLSNCCRFAGQVDEFYSVAQHAFLVAMLVPAPLRLHALHHDDSEAFMGDLSRYLKHDHLLAGYRALEAPVQAAIERRLHLRLLTAAEREQVKAADDVAALFEQIVIRERQEFSFEAIHCLIADGFVTRPFTTLGYPIGLMMQMAGGGVGTPMTPRHSRDAFLAAHHQYTHTGVTP